GEVETGVRKLETRRHNANDRVIRVVEPDAASNDVRLSSQPLTPEPMTDDHYIVAPGPVLLGRDQSALFGLRAQHWKEVGRHARPGDTLGLLTARKVEIFGVERRHRFKTPRLIAVILKFRRL